MKENEIVYVTYLYIVMEAAIITDRNKMTMRITPARRPERFPETKRGSSLKTNSSILKSKLIFNRQDSGMVW